MKKSFYFILLCLTASISAQIPTHYLKWNTHELGYHKVRSNSADGTLLPWASDDPATAYDLVLNSLWAFWDTMRTDMNGLPYYMNHQVWKEEVNDRRGVGGDQFAMMLSSWYLYYQYSGNERVLENMKFMADYYLTHSLSPAHAAWPNLPYPYNTYIYSGLYDGDMVVGKGYTQPDKAGSFGAELVKLYKMTNNSNYLNAAVDIANTLAQKTASGDVDHSPLPFKVNALTGEVGDMLSEGGNQGKHNYTTNYTGTMELYLQLIGMNRGNVDNYQKAFNLTLNWMKQYPLKNNKWGPFFEDIGGWSDTQTNATSFASFIMNHRDYFPNWKSEVVAIFDWVYATLGNNNWKELGLRVINEQSAFLYPGNSHTSRQAATTLQYATLSGDKEGVAEAIRQLNWATYMVSPEGKNCYPFDQNWFTDGYGDYVRHYLRAMYHHPELAPCHRAHLLHTSSVVVQTAYPPQLNKFKHAVVPPEWFHRAELFYQTFDKTSTETIRLAVKPSEVWVDGQRLKESTISQQSGWYWRPLKVGGVLLITKEGHKVTVLK